MTSEKRIKANRANAKASTGPKTVQGKARAAQNARRHGLSLSIFTDPILSEGAKELAHAIAGEGASLGILEPAGRVAEAQIDLVRIRQARHDLLAREPNRPKSSEIDYLPKLIAMDRYERRALSRRKFAIR